MPRRASGHHGSTDGTACPRGRLASPGPLRDAHLLLVVSVLITVLAVCAERAGPALLRQLTAAAQAAIQELPVITLTHAHQADRLSVASFVLSVAVLSLVATAAAQAGPVDSTWNKVSSDTEPVVVATWDAHDRRSAVRPRVDAMLPPVADVAHVAQVVASGRYARAAEEVGG
jgi:hypothetical protein